MKQNALVLLQWLVNAPSDERRNLMVRESAGLSLDFMQLHMPHHLCMNACNLLIAYIRSCLTAVVDDHEFCQAVAQRSVVLLYHENIKVKAQAYFLLGEMAQKQVLG